jgi:hypothetical protein
VPRVLRPIAGKDYPGTLGELTRWFPDDAACRAFLETLRWPDGFVCPFCRGDASWRAGDGHFLCARCRKKTSVTSGTIFHRSRLPLTKWLAAVWLASAEENGVSALALQRTLGIGSYETAWAMLHRLRRAMVPPGSERLSGLVEVGETYVGARETGGGDRFVHGSAVVLVAVELAGADGLGRVRLGIVPDASRIQICDFVTRSVTSGSTVRSDGGRVGTELARIGFIHEERTNEPPAGRANLAQPGVYRIAALLKGWIGGTLHSGIAHDHLAYYLDEFTFRFNRRGASRGLLFYQLLDQAVHAEPSPYRELIGGTRPYPVS